MRKVIMPILTILSWAATILLAIFFFDQRYLSAASLAPAVGCLIMVFECIMYDKANPNEVGYHPGFSEINEKTAHKKNKALTKTIVWFIPFQLLFVLFFHNIIKVVGTISLVILPFLLFSVIAAINKKDT